jgi:hypothetical protein
MPSPSTSNLPVPKSSQEFEEIVLEIYKRRLQDPKIKLYGRSGQPQKGVDIYGQQKGSGKYIGIQCKCYQDGKLKLSMIDSEIEKAEKFLPPIVEYIIATTVSRDVNIQDHVRQINEKRESEDKFFIHVEFWEDLSSYLAEPANYDLIKRFYPDWEAVFKNSQNIEDLFHDELEDLDDQVRDISSTLHWRITLSPKSYNHGLLNSIEDCTNLIEKNRIKIESSSYPRKPMKQSHSIQGSNWIGSQNRFDLNSSHYRYEYWRLYQSGQFINISKTWGDPSNNIINYSEIESTVKDVLGFSKKLCQEEIYDKGVTIRIELNNVKGFGLRIVTDPDDSISQYRKATSNSYKKTWVMQNSSSSSITEKDAIAWFVDRFESESNSY